MTTRTKILVGILLLAAMMGGVFWLTFFARIPDPIYEGKPLSYWVYMHERSPLTAHAAVRHAGTKAIPLLLQLMSAHDDPPFKRNLIALWQRQHLIQLHLPSREAMEIQHRRALWGFTVLGPDGQSAVPTLIRIYEASLSPSSRLSVIGALCKIGPGARASIPLLVRESKSPDPDIRAQAVQALGEICDLPKISIPALTQCLSDSNTFVQLNAENALGKFGPLARTAIPRLVELRSSRHFTVTVDADAAIQNIDPTVFKNRDIINGAAKPSIE